MMEYKEIEPSPLLSGHVEYFWSLKFTETSPLNFNHIILPDLAQEWIFNINYFRGEENALNATDPSFVTLKNKKGDVVKAKKGQEYFGIRFYPWGLSALTSKDMNEFRGEKMIQNSALIFSDLSEPFNDAMSKATHLHKRIGKVECLLKSQLFRTSRQTNSVLYYAINEIQQNKGDIHIKELSAKFNISKVTLNNLFLKHTGSSPKELARLCRLQSFIRQGVTTPRKITELALDCGYYDQSHLNHDFKSTVGITPSEFFKASSYFIMRS